MTGFVALSYYFMNLYMQSVIISTIIFFGGSLFIFNATVNRKGIDEVTKPSESSSSTGKLGRPETLPFLLCVLPIVNILVSIFFIVVMVLINLYDAGKIKFDFLGSLDKTDENK